MKCGNCQLEKDDSEFPVRSDSGKRRTICRTCKAKQGSASRRRLYATNPTKHSEIKEKNRVYAVERTKRLRLAALKHYSQGTMVCACCGESELAFLTLDHIDGNGAEERRRLFGNGSYSTRYYYSWLAKNNYPPGLQVLCFNCNCAKGLYGKCPHKGF